MCQNMYRRLGCEAYGVSLNFFPFESENQNFGEKHKKICVTAMVSLTNLRIIFLWFWREEEMFCGKKKVLVVHVLGF